jgi:hypothetical protein
MNKLSPYISYYPLPRPFLINQPIVDAINQKYKALSSYRANLIIPDDIKTSSGSEKAMIIE